MCFSLVYLAADPGMSLDIEGLAEVQSGAAPTAEGKIILIYSFLIFERITIGYRKG